MDDENDTENSFIYTIRSHAKFKDYTASELYDIKQELPNLCNVVLHTPILETYMPIDANNDAYNINENGDIEYYENGNEVRDTSNASNILDDDFRESILSFIADYGELLQSVQSDTYPRIGAVAESEYTMMSDEDHYKLIGKSGIKQKSDLEMITSLCDSLSYDDLKLLIKNILVIRKNIKKQEMEELKTIKPELF
jgi:hypothetical protein